MPSFCPSKSLAKKVADTFGTPTFLTDAQKLREQAKKMHDAFPMKKKILYAIKANFNPHIVRILREHGVNGIDTVSRFEIQWALKIGVPAKDIIFTGSNPSDVDLAFCAENNVLVNAGSLSEIERFGKKFPGRDIAIRINPGVGNGAFEKIITGGEKSKFGVNASDFERAKVLLKKYHLSLRGIHSHIGSGFYSPEKFCQSAEIVLAEAAHFPDLDFVDFGGGFGIGYKKGEREIDLPEFGKQVRRLLDNFTTKNGREIEMRIEPGRFLVAESTVLLSRVTTVKTSGQRTFAGIDTGMHHLIRPAMYDAHHEIVNVSGGGREIQKVDVVGNVCESSDIFQRECVIANPHEGDLVAILTAGAYGMCMSSNYNLRPMATEVMCDGKDIFLTRKRQSFQQMTENFLL